MTLARFDKERGVPDLNGVLGPPVERHRADRPMVGLVLSKPTWVFTRTHFVAGRDGVVAHDAWVLFGRWFVRGEDA